jgi:hypothetical protein
MMGVGDQARISKNILVFCPVSHCYCGGVHLLPPAAACLQRKKKKMVALSSPVKLELGILHTIMWHALALAEVSFPTWDLYVRTWASSQRTTYMSQQRR